MAFFWCFSDPSQGLQRAMPKRVTRKPTICWCEMGSPKTTEEELTMVTSWVDDPGGGRMEWRFDGHEMDVLWGKRRCPWDWVRFNGIWSDFYEILMELNGDFCGIWWDFKWDFKWDFNGIHSQKVDDILMACKWDLVRSTQWNLMGFQ